MLKSFETYFNHEEEPKSPEQIKEEKGLELAKEVKKIQERMAREGETIEGYQRMSKLLQEIKNLFEKERDYEAEVKTIVTNLKKALKEGADKDDVVESLAGVGTREAMELRKRLLEEGADKSYVVQGLAGVNTEEAEEFRRKYFGHDPTLVAQSYSTNWAVYDGVICRYGYEK